MKIQIEDVEIKLSDEQARKLADFLLGREEELILYDEWGMDFRVIRTRQGGVLFLIPTKFEIVERRLDERTAKLIASWIKAKLEKEGREREAIV